MSPSRGRTRFRPSLDNTVKSAPPSDPCCARHLVAPYYAFPTPQATVGHDVTIQLGRSFPSAIALPQIRVSLVSNSIPHASYHPQLARLSQSHVKPKSLYVPVELQFLARQTQSLQRFRTATIALSDKTQQHGFLAS